jgi:hypothetical protein
VSVFPESADQSKQHVVAFLGKPFPGEYRLMFVGYIPESDELIIPILGRHPTQRVLFAESDCGAILVVHFDTKDGQIITTIGLRDSTKDCPNPKACVMRMFEDCEEMGPSSPDLWAAFLRARQARFEHGERG